MFSLYNVRPDDSSNMVIDSFEGICTEAYI